MWWWWWAGGQDSAAEKIDSGGVGVVCRSLYSAPPLPQLRLSRQGARVWRSEAIAVGMCTGGEGRNAELGWQAALGLVRGRTEDNNLLHSARAQLRLDKIDAGAHRAAHASTLTRGIMLPPSWRGIMLPPSCSSLQSRPGRQTRRCPTAAAPSLSVPRLLAHTVRVPMAHESMDRI